MQVHKLYELALDDKELMPVVAYGSAGTGKTYGAVGAAVDWLDANKYHKVLVVRPNVSFADTNGFLKGTEREKLEPWIRPIEQNFIMHGVNKSSLANYEKFGRLSYVMLEHIQGLTWDNTFIIVDECQNMTFDQLRVLVTRLGNYSKLVLCGDVAQVSSKFRGSGLAKFIDMVKYYDLPVHTIEFTRDDILRSDMCKKFIVAFEEWEKK